MATRAAARGLRLLQKRGFLDGPPATRLGARFCGSSSRGAAVPPSCSCEKEVSELRRELSELRRELLETRRESLNENHHIWNRIDDLLKVNHELRDSMVLVRAQNTKNQIEAVDSMVKTSYAIVASCGAFALGIFTVMTPLMKKEWQHDTLEMWEKRLRVKGPPGKGKGTSRELIQGEEEEDVAVPAESKTDEVKRDGQELEKGPAVSAEGKKKGADAQQAGTMEKRSWFLWGGNGSSSAKSYSADQNSGNADKGVGVGRPSVLADKETGQKK